MRTLGAAILLLHGGLLAILTAILAITCPLILGSLPGLEIPPPARLVLAVAALTALFAVADGMLLAGTQLLDRSLPHLVVPRQPAEAPGIRLLLEIGLRALRKAAFLPLPLVLLLCFAKDFGAPGTPSSLTAALFLAALFSAAQAGLRLSTDATHAPIVSDGSTPP